MKINSQLLHWNNKKISIRFLVCVSILFISLCNLTGQTTVFYDDFNRATLTPGGLPTMDYTITNTGTSVVSLESGLAVTTVPELKVTGSSTAARCYISGVLASFSAPFSSTLSSNTGLVTWSFNTRHNRSTQLNGFDSGQYGNAIILVASSADLTTANGYAVVSGGSGSDVYRLVRFGAGLKTASITNLVTGGTQTDKREYMSCKVTYDPASGTWSYYDRSDGTVAAPAWTDPSTGTYTLRGTSTDATYTGTAMTNFGFSWNSAATGNHAWYDNFKVTVDAVVTDPTLNLSAATLSGFNYAFSSAGPSASQSFNVSGLKLAGFPGDIKVSGSTDFEVSTDNSVYSDSVKITFTAETLSSTPVYVRLKAGLAIGNYSTESISVSGGGAPAKTLTCSGAVTLLASTQGTLTVTVTTSTAGGSYSPKSLDAIWIENSGTFVKTIMGATGGNRGDLGNWSAASANNTIDAVTSATRSAYGVRQAIWNGTNTATPREVLSDGTYTVQMEMTDGSAGTAVTGTFNFDKGPAPQTLTPANIPSFSNITIKWVPTISAVNQSSLSNMYSVYPNPTTSYIYVNGFDVQAIEIYTLSGVRILKTNNQKINLSTLAKGVYLAKIVAKSGTVIKKIQKN